MELLWPRFDHSWEASADLIRIYQTVSELDFSHYAAQHTASVRPPTRALGLFACRFPATTRKKDRPKEPAEVLAEAL
jgi:hypothetical protein